MYDETDETTYLFNRLLHLCGFAAFYHFNQQIYRGKQIQNIVNFFLIFIYTTHNQCSSILIVL